MTPPKFFRLEELVSRALFNQYRNRPQYLWGLFDGRFLLTIDRLRSRFGRCVINDWRWGGEFQYSGFREPACKIGAILSQHRFGRGGDLKFSEITPVEFRAEINRNQGHPAFEFITCVELDTPTWSHVDCRTHMSENKILWVKG